ncbi:MAG: fimbrial biogenesis outer membrane usher protein, partial [Alphaproteobacteria bacterium]|nr:fimbrial biogenesis outer membrane usher protein [Alphaproteobacteria bacterium]
GLFRFSLDRASTVDVVVNGTTIRTLRLDAGQYDLKDFPLFNGLNDVELYVVDEFGRRLIAAFSQFFSAKLLNTGVAEYGATLGIPQRRDGGDELTYDDTNLTFSGYGRYGLLDDVTVGANFQIDKNQWLAGIELGWASPVGTLGVVTGWSDIDGLSSGNTTLVSY